jgi:hypothetical protein
MRDNFIPAHDLSTMEFRVVRVPRDATHVAYRLPAGDAPSGDRPLPYPSTATEPVTEVTFQRQQITSVNPLYRQIALRWLKKLSIFGANRRFMSRTA